MRNDLPNNEAWITRFKALRDWTSQHGRIPKNRLAGGQEDTLRTWLNRQREAVLVGQLDENLVKILKMVPGAVPGPGSAGKKKAVAGQSSPAATDNGRGTVRLQRREDFYLEHGRLPKSSATAPGEEALYAYLNSVVRVQYRKNEIPAKILKRLGAIPGVLVSIYSRPEDRTEATAAARRLAESEGRMAELLAFLTESKRLPRLSSPQPEPRLRAYLYKVVRPAYLAGRLDPEAAHRLDTALPGCLIPKNYSQREDPPASLAA